VSEKEFLPAGTYKKLIRGNPFLLYELRGDKQPIGFYEQFTPFSNFELSLAGNETLYFFTDGYADQFGGPKGKKMMVSRLKKFILNNAHLSLFEQKEALVNNFFHWKGNLEQVDDVSFFALRF
jgi:serine phosphatase RsbU (regulator of sigma subunit)